jgi:hypothetical protein
MQTNRTDVTRNKRKVLIDLGYNTFWLRYKDHFLYRESYTDGTFQYRFARCHGQVKPDWKDGEVPRWYVLAQVADQDMMHTYERWVEPKDIVRAVSHKYVDSCIEEFFRKHEHDWDKKGA